jgi:thymidylate synthase ThyX
MSTSSFPLSPRSYEPEKSPSERLLVRLRLAEARVDLLQQDLIAARQRTTELKDALDAMRNVLKHARVSRDMWKGRAAEYQHEIQLRRQRIWYFRNQRDFWRHRALAKDET